MEPLPSRPILSSDYWAPSGEDATLPWSYVSERMESALHYWLSTVGPEDAPHTRPINGMWLDDKLYFGGSPASRWCRNLAINTEVCVNLSESGEQAVILHGSVGSIRPDSALSERLADASNAKYNYGQKISDYEGEDLFVFNPRVVFAWTMLTKDRTRWKFR